MGLGFGLLWVLGCGRMGRDVDWGMRIEDFCGFGLRLDLVGFSGRSFQCERVAELSLSEARG